MWDHSSMIFHMFIHFWGGTNERFFKTPSSRWRMPRVSRPLPCLASGAVESAWQWPLGSQCFLVSINSRRIHKTCPKTNLPPVRINKNMWTAWNVKLPTVCNESTWIYCSPLCGQPLGHHLWPSNESSLLLVHHNVFRHLYSSVTLTLIILGWFPAN